MFDCRRPRSDITSNGKGRVLVVGTTPDYVDLLRRQCPDRCLFLTESRLRRQATEPQPEEEEEVLYRWEKQLSAWEVLRRHRDRHGIRIDGIACFDCESMPLASFLARQFGLPYPSSEAVGRCRNKARMRRCWQVNGTPCPRSLVARRPDEAVRFLHEIGGACVLKPLSGSGSELVFRVDQEADCRQAFEQVTAGLRARRAAPLYRSCKEGRASVLLEEYVEGDEFSCDFLIERRRVRVIRLTGKYRRREGPFGAIEAYELSSDRPDVCRDSRLEPYLLRAASSLGIDRAICMADFVVSGNRPVFLELTPRCGGDCLPSLLKTACDFDVLGLALRFAGESVGNVKVRVAEPVVALRLFANRAGTLLQTDTTALADDPRVLSVVLTRQPGAQLQLPPLDYDSWILGHVIYRPDPLRDVSVQNDELTSLFRMRIAPG